MVTLKNELGPNIIEARDLKDGQLAIIIDTRFDDYKDRIVQRFGDSMVAIGLSKGNGWSDITNNIIKVRVLDEDELLVITNNK